MYNPEVLQENILVSFFDKSIKNNFKSAEEGVPIFNEVLYISKTVPFKEKDSVQRKATSEDKSNYPQAFQAYENREKFEGEGTLVKNWNYPSESEVQMLLTHKIVTIEQVAALDDIAVKRMGNGGRALRDTARKYIEQADGVDKLAEDLKTLKKESSEQIAELEKECEELKGLLNGLRLENKDLNNENKRLEAINDTPKRNTKRSKRDGAIHSTS